MRLDGDWARERLDAASAGRERALAGARKTIRCSANAIRAIHRRDWAEAQTLMDEARDTLRDAESALADFPAIFYAGFLQDAQKEYTEARATYAIVRDEDPPSAEELGVGPAPYLNGLGETVGELRRHILDRMRHDELELCEGLLNAMDDIYFVLTSMDYPDAITMGLRRTTDVSRSLIERTRGELTMAIQQNALHRALEAHSAKVEGLSG